MTAPLDHSFDTGFDTTSTTALGYLIHEGTESDIKKRLEADIDWNEETYHPLHAALLAGNDSVARTLLEKGSPVVSHSFYIAYRFGNPSAFQHLLEKYLPALTSDEAFAKNISSLLLDVARANDTKTAQIICPLVPDINTTDYFYGFENWTALHHASASVNLELITILLTHDADPNLYTNKKESCLDLVHRKIPQTTSKQRQACAALLTNHGAHSAKLSWLQIFFLINFGYAI